jgi:hypothetical protein
MTIPADQTTFSRDLEPEYVVLNHDETKAWITLQAKPRPKSRMPKQSPCVKLGEPPHRWHRRVRCSKPTSCFHHPQSHFRTTAPSSLTHAEARWS